MTIIIIIFLIALLGVLFEFMLVGICIAIGVVTILSSFVAAIPLYIMVKKANHRFPWLAFIPLGNIYLMYTISNKPFVLFEGEIYIKDRTTVFLYYVLLLVLYAFGIFMCYCIRDDYFAFMDGLILVQLVFYAAKVVLQYPMYKDMYDMFMYKKDNRVLSIISAFSFFIATIQLWRICKNKPVQYVSVINTEDII